MNIPSVNTSLPAQARPEVRVMANEARLAEPSKTGLSPAQTVQAAEKPAGQEQLKAAVKSVQEYIEPFNNNLEFSVNDQNNQVVIKVVDKATKEVIRQIPSEEMIAMAKALDSIKGLFVKQQA